MYIKMKKNSDPFSMSVCPDLIRLPDFDQADWASVVIQDGRHSQVIFQV